MNKYKKVLDWLKEYTMEYDWIDFNVTPVQVGNMSVNSVPGIREINQFIDGTREVEMQFSIDLITKYDTGTSTINLDAIQEFNNISEWIDEQNEIGNYPDIDGVIIEEVSGLQLYPTLTIDASMKKAKYQGQYKLTYMEV